MKNIPMVVSTLNGTEIKNKLERILELVESLEESYNEINELSYFGEKVFYGTEEECEEEIFNLQKTFDDDMDELLKLLES